METLPSARPVLTLATTRSRSCCEISLIIKMELVPTSSRTNCDASLTRMA